MMTLFPSEIYTRASVSSTTFYTCYQFNTLVPDDWSRRISGTRLKAPALFDDNPIARK